MKASAKEIFCEGIKVSADKNSANRNILPKTDFYDQKYLITGMFY